MKRIIREKATFSVIALSIAIMSVVAYPSSHAHAIEREIGASVQFIQSLLLTKVDADFGTIEFSPGAGSNDITLTPSTSAMSCSNTAEYTCPATGTPGEIAISGTAGLDVNVFCDATGALSNGTDTLDMQAVQLGHNSTDYNCSGLGQSALIYNLTGTAADQFNIGGVLKIPATGIGDGGNFSTTESGGAAITIRIVYL